MGTDSTGGEIELKLLRLIARASQGSIKGLPVNTIRFTLEFRNDAPDLVAVRASLRAILDSNTFDLQPLGKRGAAIPSAPVPGRRAHRGATTSLCGGLLSRRQAQPRLVRSPTSAQRFYAEPMRDLSGTAAQNPSSRIFIAGRTRRPPWISIGLWIRSGRLEPGRSPGPWVKTCSWLSPTPELPSTQSSSKDRWLSTRPQTSSPAEQIQAIRSKPEPQILVMAPPPRARSSVGRGAR